MLDIILTIVFIVVCGAIGKGIEIMHFRRLKDKEEELAYFPATTLKKSYEQNEIIDSALVVAEATVSVDYYKRFMAIVLSLFGLNIYVYETLLDRCRREAMIRLKKSALAMNANAVINVKLDTVLFNSGRTKSTHCVSIIASGTAIDMVRK